MALHDVKEKATTVQLDRERHIKFDLNAFAELEDIYGSLNAVFAALQSGSMKAARTLLWAGLLHEDEALTPPQVGSMVNLDNLESVVDILSDAMTTALPEADAAPVQEEAAPDPT